MSRPEPIPPTVTTYPGSVRELIARLQNLPPDGAVSVTWNVKVDGVLTIDDKTHAIAMYCVVNQPIRQGAVWAPDAGSDPGQPRSS